MSHSSEEQPPELGSGAKALQAFEHLAFADAEDCPTTYLYDIPGLWDFEEPMSSLAETGWENFGGHGRYSTDCEEGIKSVNQYAMPLIMLYRLLTSQRCKMTTDPEKADLFLVPYLPRPKMDTEWCRGKEGGIDPTPFLIHMNHRTAHKHLFLFGKGHMAMATCNPWFIHPTNLLRRAIRVTYSMPARGYPPKGSIPAGYKLHKGYGPLDGRNLTLGVLSDLMSHFDKNHEAFPHTYSVPYPATGVLGATPLNEPWKRFSAPRRLLASYVGRTHGMFGMEVRQKIVEDCRKAGASTCLTADVSDRCRNIFQKSEAYFCLEPGGDSPNRKSLWDSLSLGCVPVLFSPHQQILAPWHWGHFRNSSSVYINREDYLEGKIDLFKTLAEIAASGELHDLRKSIAQHGHATQYSLRDYPGDGFERTLIGAHRAARRYERRHWHTAESVQVAQ